MVWNFGTYVYVFHQPIAIVWYRLTTLYKGSWSPQAFSFTPARLLCVCQYVSIDCLNKHN
jgi:hypothetical protein